MKALVSEGNAQFALKELPKPVPGPNQMLVRVIAAAANPSDRKFICNQLIFRTVITVLLEYKLNGINEAGLIIGSDYAGYVEELGAEVPQGILSKGDRVAGFLMDMSKYFGGSYAEYCLADPFTAVVIPEGTTFEEAATVGLSGFTACQTLFQSLRIENPLNPTTKREPILVWGAASVLGMYVVQLANLAGYNVVATASSSNFDLLKSLGAVTVFDYNDENVSQKVRESTNCQLALAVDCISDLQKGTPQKVTECFGSQGGRVSTVLPFDSESLRKDVSIHMVMVYTLLGQAVDYPIFYPPMKEHHADGQLYAKILTQLLREKKLVVPPIRVIPNGLAGVSEGLAELAAGKVRAQKLVYRIEETP